MCSNIFKLLTLYLCFFISEGRATEIWTENFSTPGRGIWGDDGGVPIHTAFDVINMPLQNDNVTLSNLYDIVINEIMADPNPPVNLPKQEFIELYNRSLAPINLGGWFLKVRDAEKKLGNVTLLPGEYLILCKTGAFDEFSSIGKSLAVPGFPALINSGCTIELKNERGVVIDAVSYSDDWYRNSEKDNGGWSLERIDPNRFCGQSRNWVASVAEDGGTPGAKNSVRAGNPDIEAPYLIWATAISENKIEIKFSEEMDTTVLKQVSNYVVSDGIGPPGQVIFNSGEVAVLSFAGHFLEDKVYALELKNMNDECGNLLTGAHVEIQWVVVKPGDVVINEVLFNPYPDGADFVELVNISQKAIPFYRLFLASRSKELELKQVYTVWASKSSWQPGSYLLCTPYSAGVSDFYFSECHECFLEMEKFPSYPNKEGDVVLLADSATVIDEFMYSEKMHSIALYDEEGVSLERVAFISETNQPSSWQSAAESAGYATPGYKNSQYLREIPVNKVVVEPKSFSPNEDGFHDRMYIKYQMGKAGNIANSWIFDSTGRLVYQLMKNEVLGTQGSIKWDGKDETGQMLSLGVYVVLVEVFNTDGQVMKFKDVCILTGILE